MYVDRIELFGFKSFMHRTEIPLSRGITAIVGPNGCGKSNISDALRWVLGEQNARHLRGEKIEDVIFKGSGQHKALGMAEVGMVIQNDDGRLPVEYTQVAIARRVFRSGDSEFAINKVACRLKDIRDLFLGTGLGSTSYSLIERDMVDQVLSDKDDARRLLFEEASGIIRYKQKRKEAERKLEGVELDLTRIEDTVREIERTVRSLARQAGKVRRYRRLKEELDRHEIRFAWERWNRLRDESRTNEEARRIREAQKQDLGAAISSSDAKREVERQALGELSDALEGAQQALEQSTRELASAHEETRVLTTRNEAWTREEGELRRQDERHRERRAELEAEEAHLRPRRTELLRLVDEVRAKSREASRVRAESERRLREVRAQLQAAQQTNLDLVSSHGETRKELEAIEKRRESDAQRLDGLRGHLGAFETRVQQVEWFLGEARGDAERLVAEHTERSAERETLSRERSLLRAAREETQRELTEAARARTTLESRWTVLEEQRQRHAGFDAAVRWLLEHRDELPGLVGVAGERVRLRPGVEISGRAALDGLVPWILVRDEDAALELIDRLRGEGLGGVTFFPLAEAGVHEPLERGPDPDAARAVAELFDADPEAEPFVRWIARRTRLAGSIEEARRGSRASGRRFIAPAGEIVEGFGPIHMSGGESIEVEILRREQEIPTLRTELSGVLEAHRALEERSHDLRTRDEELETSLHASDETVTRLEKERSAATVRKSTLETELAMLREEHTRLDAEANGLIATLAVLAEDAERFRSLVTRRGEDSESAQALFEELRARAEAAEEERDGLVRAATDCEMEQLRVENELRGSEARIGELAREAQERERAIEEITSRVEVRTREAEDAGARIETLATESARLESERQTRERKVHDVRSRQLESQERLAGLDHELKGLRANFDHLTQSLHQEEIDRLQTQTEAEQLRLRMLEEHAIDLGNWTGPESFRELVTNSESLDDTDGDEGEDQDPDRVDESAPAALTDVVSAEIDPSLGGALQRLSVRARRRREEELEAEEALSVEERSTRIHDLRRRLQEMGNLNFVAAEEYKTEKDRLDFQVMHASDLRNSRLELLEAIRQINEKASVMFAETFTQVQANFQITYQQLFPGGESSLRLIGADPLEGDIEISARPKGKKLESIRLLSTGERSLTAIALLFAIYLAKPSPVCLLDEVDAPLDDANLDRFLTMIRHFSERTQFIMITHNKKTMAQAGRLFGVTMEEPGVSKIVSVRLNESGVEIVEGVHAGTTMKLPPVNGGAEPGGDPIGTA